MNVVDEEETEDSEKESDTKTNVPTQQNNNSVIIVAAAAVGLIAQPVVWTSLYYVATTGAGLPSGPYGLLGGLEGVSYLIILGLVGASTFRNVITTSGSGTSSPLPAGGLMGIAERLSYVSLLAGLVTLASLVVDRGCVPNAKPILDYSDYLPVCGETPGLFGE